MTVKDNVEPRYQLHRSRRFDCYPASLRQATRSKVYVSPLIAPWFAVIGVFCFVTKLGYKFKRRSLSVTLHNNAETGSSTYHEKASSRYYGCG